MKRVGRKAASILLTLCMLLTMLPVSALAAASQDCSGGDSCMHEAAIGTTHYDTIGEAIDAANGMSGSDTITVTLLKNATMTGGRTNGYYTTKDIARDITLDLGGHTLEYAENGGFLVNPGCHFTVQNGTYINTSTDSWAQAITGSHYNSSSTGATITVASNAVIRAVIGVCADGYTTLNVYGTIDSTKDGVYVAGPKNDVTLNGAKIEAGVYGVYQQGNGGGSSYDIKNSTITTPNTKGSCAVFISNSKESAENSAEGMQTLNIENSVISGQDGIEVRYTNVTISGDRTEVTSAEDGYALGVTHNGSESAVGNLSITGGTFTGDIWVMEGTANTATLTISGGNFSFAIPEEYCAGGFAPVNNGDGTWSVKEEEETPPEPTGVAQIGDQTYPTLETAIEAAQSDETVKLIADVDLTKVLIIGKSVDLDLNGYTIRQTGSTTMEWCDVYSCPADMCEWNSGQDDHSSKAISDAIHVVGNQTEVVSVNIRDTSEAQTGAVIAGENANFAVAVYGNNLHLKIYGGTYSGGSRFCVFNSYRWTQSWTTLYGGTYKNGVQVNTIRDGTFQAKLGSDETWVCAHDIYDGTYGEGTDAQATEFYDGTFNGKAQCYSWGQITGGTFNGYLRTWPNVNRLSDCTINGPFEWGSWKGDPPPALTNVTFGENASLVYDENYEIIGNLIVKIGSVALIGSQSYETLEAAFAAVEDNQETTITLLKDIAVSAPITIGEAKNVIFDMKGHTITAGEDFSTRVFTNNGTLTITGNGTIDVTAAGANGYGAVNNYGTLTVENGTYKNLKESNASTFYNRNGGTATFGTPTIYGGGGCVATEVNTTTTINGGYYENETYPAVENRGDMTITAGTFKNTSCSSCDGSKWGYTVRSGESSENAYLKIQGETLNSVKVTGVQGGLAVIGGTADIYNGVYETVACDVHTNGSSAFYAGYFTGESYETAVTIYDGTFQSVSKTAVLVGNSNPPPDSGAGKDSTAMIKGGTFIGGDAAKTAITVKNAAYAKGGASISGGTFSSKPSEEFFAEGFKPKQNEDGTWGVVTETTYVAQIGETKYATLSEALNAVKGGETIKVLAPATVDMAETYAITGKAITLDLNGQTVTWNSSAKNMIEIGSDGGLTIQDATDDGVLHFFGTGTTSYGSGINTSGDGSLTLTGGTVLYEHSKAGYGLNIGGSSTFTMTGGTVKIAGAVNYAVRLASTSQCQLNGGQILFDEGTTATTLYGVYAVLYSAGDAAGFSLGNLIVDGSMVPDTKTVVCVYGYNDSTPVTISDGTYTANSKSSSYAVGGGSSNNTAISGGTFNGAVKAAIGKVTGGQFSVQPSAAYLSKGKIYELQQDGYYHVVDGAYVARLGTVGYTSWEALWNDASEGATASAVYILADVNEITVPAGKNVTFYNSGNCAIGKITNNGTCKIISDAMTGTKVVNNGSLNLGHEVKSLVNNQGATMEATSYSYAKVTDSITNSGTMTISKGTYPCTITNTGTITLTGGSFAQEVIDWCAEGYTTQKSGELWTVVRDGDHVAEIDGYWYTSLSAAINAARDGDTVKLLMDTTLTPTTTGTGLKSAIIISGGSKPNLTLDLNGKTISWDQTYASQTLSTTPVMFSITGGANITITGNGTIDTELGSNTSYGINMTTSTKNQLTIENGTFTGAPTAIQVEKGTLTILDGTFKLAETVAQDKPEQAKYVVNAIDRNWMDDSANISIQGGSFCFDPSDNPEGTGSSYVAEGFEATASADGKFEIVKIKVAEVGDVQYATLTEAINAATEGQTIKLLANSTGNTTATISDGRKLTLNMNGFNAGFIKNNNISIYRGGLNIIGSGKLYEEEPYLAPVLLYGSNDSVANEYTTVTVGENVTLEGWAGLFINKLATNSDGANAFGIKATVNGKLNSVKDIYGAGGHALYVNGTISATKGNVPKITLNGATLTTEEGNGMYLAGYAKTTITDSTINSTGANSTGIEIRAGELTISGITTVSGGEGEFVAGPNGNGSTTNNVALAVVQHTTKLPVIVTVEGGTFNGGAAIYQADEQGNGAEAVAKVQISVEDGIFNGVVYSENKTNFITGGTFSKKPDKAYCAEGYAPVDNGNGTWDVEMETTYVAEVNGQKYQSLIEAVEAATAGQTVKLLANVELQPVAEQDYLLMIDANQSMTLDLNGHKITAEFTNTEGFNLIMNYGELTITDSSADQNGSIEVTENGSAEKLRTSVIYNVITGEFTLKAGTLKLTGSESSKKPLYGVYSTGITMAMNGGTIEVRRLNSYSKYSESWDVYGIYNQGSDSKTTVNGGTITVENQGRYNSAYGIFNASGTVSIHGDPNTPYIEANAFNDGIWYEHTLYGKITLYGGKYNMQTEYATGWIEGENDIIIAEGYEKKFPGDRIVSIVKSPVAQIGTTKYDTLEAAVAAVKSGETIKLLTDVTDGSGIIVPSGSNFTIDFGGHTYTVTNNLAGSTGTKSQCFQLLRDSTITMQNGAIVADNPKITMIIQNYANLTLDDMTLDATQGTNNGVSYVMSNNCGNVTITGDTDITAKEGEVAFDVYYWPSGSYVEGVTVTVDENMTGTITGKVEYAADDTAQDADVAEKAKLYIEAGTFIGSIVTEETSHGISISGGSFSVKPEDGYLAPYYEATQNTIGGYWTVDLDASVEAIWITDTTTKAGMLSDLLDEATSGTVQLLKAVTATGNITVTTNVTLDLAGKTLDTTEKTFSAFGKVVDSAEGKGLLKLQEGSYTVREDNPSLPIYDSTADGYRLYTYQYKELYAHEVAGQNTVQFWFELRFDNTDAWKLLANGATHGLRISSKYRFSEADGWTELLFNDGVIQKVAKLVVDNGHTQDEIGFYLNVTSIDLLGERTMSVMPKLYTATDVTCEAGVMTYSLSQAAENE